MATPKEVALSNEKELEQATTQLLKFCDEEYVYYDGLSDSNPKL
jgi:hypothetical protein